jgi:hypothetical protein
MFNLFGKKDTVKNTEVDTKKADGAEILFEELRYIHNMFNLGSDKIYSLYKVSLCGNINSFFKDNFSISSINIEDKLSIIIWNVEQIYIVVKI